MRDRLPVMNLHMPRREENCSVASTGRQCRTDTATVVNGASRIPTSPGTLRLLCSRSQAQIGAHCRPRRLSYLTGDCGGLFEAPAVRRLPS